MSKTLVALACASAFVVTGCVGGIDKASYATDPVQVQTEQGVVTCQLYRHDRVIWDEAIDFPKSMSLQQADAVCQDEGFRRLGK